MNELADIRAAVGEVEKRLSGNHSHAAIHISGGGAVAVIVGLVAVVCLIAASALAYVSWQQSQLTERQTAELRDRVEMAEAKMTLIESRQNRGTK